MEFPDGGKAVIIFKEHHCAEQVRVKLDWHNIDLFQALRSSIPFHGDVPSLSWREETSTPIRMAALPSPAQRRVCRIITITIDD